MKRPLALAAILCLSLVPAAQTQRTAADHQPFRFAVLGHIRGGHDGMLNPKLAELVEQVRREHVDLVLLTGDAIFGDYDSTPSRPAELEAEWERVDSALATLHVPVYRVPGNHDLNDGPSRMVFERRYGMPPRVVTFRDTRFILLRTPFLPGAHDTIAPRHISGVDLDSTQRAFVRQTLADSAWAHTFVFMHHLLWWQQPSGRWWREVHPMLAAARVDAVFSGDYGPMKFSTMEKDGVRYYQGSMEPQVPIVMLGNFPRPRLLSSQFDTWFLVDVDSVATVHVRTNAEVSGGDFTPQRWRAIEAAPALPLKDRMQIAWGEHRRLFLLAAALCVVCFVAGLLLGATWRRRHAPRSPSA